MMIQRSLLVVALGLAACGPSSADVNKAKTAAYNTDFAKVWNACDTELKDRFHADGLKIEDPGRGVIETKWEALQTGQEGSVDIVDDPHMHARGVTPTRIMWRMFIKIQPGGPPWRISVDGEAALYRAEMSMLTPYKHGAIDEPEWVPNRIDGIRVAIHERLKEYAVNVPEGLPLQAPEPAPASAPAAPQ